MIDIWLTPHAVLAFLTLALSIISLWIKRSPWIWGGFLTVALAMAYFAKLMTPVAFIPLAGLFFLIGIYRTSLPKYLRLFCGLLIFSLALLLFTHRLPGFAAWEVINTTLSKDAISYKFYLNFDKPLVGLFLLVWSFPLINTKETLIRVAKPTLLFTLVGIATLIGLSNLLDVVHFEPKLPSFFWLWFFTNLLFVCVSEEAFMRGFVQRELIAFFGQSKMVGQALGLILTALLFALLHLAWVPNITFTILAFAAGLIYGFIYLYTGYLESAIFCHFTLNLLHLLLFTYPALKMD